MANTAFDHASALTLPGSTTNNGLVRWGDTSAGSFGNITGITSDGSNLTLLTRGEIRFSDADSSHYIALESPATVGTSYTMALPAAVPSANDYLKVTSYSGGAGVLEWASVSADTNTTYSTSWVDSSNDAILRLTPSTGSADDLTIVAGSGITLTPSGDNLTIASSGGASLSGSTNNTIVTVTGANAMQGEAKLTYDGDGMLTMSNSSGSNNWLNHATATSGTANPSRLILRTASGNAGDTYISFHGVDTYEYSVGVDTSDVGSGGRRFKISGSALGTNDKLTLQPDGRFVINPTSATNPVGSGPFAIKAFSSNDVNLEMYCAGSDVDAGYRFRTFERGSGGSSGSHSYVSQSAVQIMTSGGAGSRGAILWVHGEQDGDTNVFCDMVVVPVTGGFSNNSYSASGASVGTGNVIFRLNMRGSPANRTYSLDAHNTLYLTMSSGNYNVVTMMMGLTGIAT